MKEFSGPAEFFYFLHYRRKFGIDQDFSMLNMAFSDKLKNKLAFAPDLQMPVLKRRYAKSLIVPGAFFGSDAEIQRIYQPHHYGQNLFPRKAVKRNMLIGYLTQLRQIFSKALDPFKFLPLLSGGKFRVIKILDAARRIHANGLEPAAGGRRYTNVFPRRRDYKAFYPFQMFVRRDFEVGAVYIVKSAGHRAFSLPPA